MMIGIVALNVIWEMPKTRERTTPSTQILRANSFKRRRHPMLFFRR